MRSKRSWLTWAAAGLTLVLLPLGQGPAEAAGGDVVLVSSDSSGTEGNDYSGASSMGAEGRYVAFQSYATDLHPDATDGSYQIFRKDTVTDAVVLASCNVAGVEADSDCMNPSMTPDGRYVVFRSSASNLAGPGTNLQIFRKDLGTGVVVLVSCTAAGVEGDAESRRPTITNDGRYVVFASYATNLGGTGAYRQTFVKDMSTGTLKLVSSSGRGAEANSETGHPTISVENGLYVAFHSSASNLHAAAGGSNTQVFRKNIQTGAIWLVSRSDGGAEADDKSKYAAISGDGRYVTFGSWATNLDAAATGAAYQIFRKDLNTGALTFVSCDASGVEGNADAEEWGRNHVSDDGRFVAFLSEATNLDTAATSGNDQAFRKDLVTGVILLVSCNVSGVTEANSEAWRLDMTPDGRYVSFRSQATNLDGAASGADEQVFRKELATYSGASTNIMLVSSDSSGTEGDGDSRASHITSDGRYVAIQSGATNLVAAASSGDYQIFRKDVVTGAVRLASCTAGGVQADADCNHPEITPSGRYVAFHSSATNLPGTGTDTQVYRKDLATGAIRIVSCNAAGVEGDSYSQRPKISDDGRYVVFESEAVSLGADGVNKQILLKDLNTGTVSLVSSSAAGVTSDSTTGHPSMTPDGLYVVFHSYASNLVTMASGTDAQVYRKNTQTGAILLVSSPVSGVTEANAKSKYSAVSADGRYVTFNSEATNLDGAATAGDFQVFRKDLDTGAITLVSSNASGLVGDDYAAEKSPSCISDDGRFVTFVSTASNFVPVATGTDEQVFRKDLLTGEIVLASCDVSGSAANDWAWRSTMTPDGRYVTFYSQASNLDPAATGGSEQVFRKEMPTYTGNSGDLTLVSCDVAGVAGNAWSYAPRVVVDGNYVVFHSSSINLDAAATNGSYQVFLKNLATGEITLVSCTAAGVEGDSDSTTASMTKDHRYVVFASDATNLDPAATSGTRQIFRKDLVTGAIALASCDSTGVEGDDESRRPRISDNGRYVAFESWATNLGGTGTYKQVFLKDLSTGTITLVSSNAAGVEDNYGGGHPAMTPDGLYIAFQSKGTNILPGASNGSTQIFRKNLNTGEVVLVSGNASGFQGNNDSKYATISSNGRYIGFSSYATNLAAGAASGNLQAFMKDLTTGTVTLASCDASGLEADDDMRDPHPCPVSDDGRFVAFCTDATNLHPAATGTNRQIFRKDLLTGEVLLVSIDDTGSQADASTWRPGISRNARYMVFYSNASNLNPAATGANGQVFLKEFSTYTGSGGGGGYVPAASDDSGCAPGNSLPGVGLIMALVFGAAMLRMRRRRVAC